MFWPEDGRGWIEILDKGILATLRLKPAAQCRSVTATLSRQSATIGLLPGLSRPQTTSTAVKVSPSASPLEPIPVLRLMVTAEPEAE